ncbi:hypothetical protein F2Q69_00040769 [Brassica cretica]|uniref:Uncharacterized protein n=1 Tax=Brassica cretica TaxID=69181 RepID=A0A8S9NJN0_BRACR|nr:hypothetical protein F2Q69_00040769 [Brassica cretica]
MRDHDRDLQAQAELLRGGSFHGVSWRDRVSCLYTRDIESNDLVNHIGGVFRYFIVDVMDPGSTPDVTRCGRELEHRLIDSWSPRLEEERHMKKLPSETEETRKHRLIDSWSPRLEEERHMKKLPSETEETRKLHKFTEEGFTRLRVTHKIRWWQAASIRKKGFRAVFDLQSQGVCDSHKVFSEGFHGVLGLSLHGISVADGVLIYVVISARGYSLVSVKGVEEGFKDIDLCGYVFGATHSFLLEWICENEELLV